MRELDILATLDNLDEVLAFVDEELEKMGCPQRDMYQIDVCVEEIFSNIANYAYNPDTGPATIRVEVLDDPKEITLTFFDHGTPFDPLAKRIRTSRWRPKSAGSADWASTLSRRAWTRSGMSTGTARTS